MSSDCVLLREVLAARSVPSCEASAWWLLWEAPGSAGGLYLEIERACPFLGAGASSPSR